jgi:DNA-binding GntR family transcriptional regulator
LTVETPEAHERDAGLAIRLPTRLILADETYEVIKALIMNHQLRPGERVNIDALARDLRVSPTPVREALARLESDGLVVKEPLRGSRTTALLNRREFDDLYEMRFLLEPWAARRAADAITPAGRERIGAEIAVGVPILAGSDYATYKSMFEHDARFHELIFELAGNQLLQSVWNRAHCHLHLFRLYYAAGLGSLALQEHQEVSEALMAGDADRAESAMRRHLSASRNRLLPAISAQDSGSPPPAPETARQERQGP